jgi:uncharacterized protein (TIGR03086 family)
MASMPDIQVLDRRAVEASRSLVSHVTADRLAQPTPCADWDLSALLAHMTVQHHGFARAVAGERTGLTDWRPAPAADPVAAYDEAADRVIAAFGAPGVTEGSAFLPEIRGGVTLPVSMAIGFHFVDYVVHSWDVAATLGLPLVFDDEVLAAALAVAEQVPDDEGSRGLGMAFGPAQSSGADARTLERVLTRLGRTPAWPNGSLA